MVFRKNKKNEELIRKRTDNTVDSRATKFSYHSVRSASDTNTGRSNKGFEQNKPAKPKTSWWLHVITYLLVIIIFGSILYTLTLSTDPKVEIVDETSQTIVQPASVYQKAAQKIFQSSLQNRTKLSINTDKLASQIEAKYPEINAVTIVIPLIGHQPLLEIRPAQSIFILSNTQGKFIINQQGNAVLQLNNTLASKYSLAIVTDATGFKFNLGQDALPDTSVKFIKTVIDQFAAKSIPIQSLTLSTTPYELDVQVRGVPYYIKFNLLSDPLYATGTYFSIVKLFSPTNPGPSQYLDIRIPGRAYYK